MSFSSLFVRATTLSLVLSLMGACSGKDDDKDTGPKEEEEDRLADFIFFDQEVKGDFNGWGGGDSFDTTEWLVQDDPPSSLQVDQAAELTVLDFQEDTPVGNARVQVWNSDLANDGAADQDQTSDENGVVTLSALPSCHPFTYLTTTSVVPVETKPTFLAHEVFAFDADGTINDELNSVSDITYKLIPAILGLDPDPKTSIIAGAIYDLTGDDTVENAQVVVYVDGEIPDSLVVEYFVSDFPARGTDATSADGLWIAIDVPVGEVRAEAWGVLNGEMTLLGASKVVSQADSINIASIYTGYSDGVYFPAGCYN